MLNWDYWKCYYDYCIPVYKVVNEYFRCGDNNYKCVVEQLIGEYLECH